MLFAKVIAGSVVKYPYTLNDLKSDHPQTSFPLVSFPGDKELFDVVEVSATASPVPGAGQKLVELTPVLVGAVWTQTWSVVSLTPQEQADKVKAQKLAAMDAVISSDTTLAAARVAAEDKDTFDAWWTANVTNTAQILDLFKRVVRALLRKQIL